MKLEIKELNNCLDQRDTNLMNKSEEISALEKSLEGYKAMCLSTLEKLKLKMTRFDVGIQVNPDTRNVDVSVDLLPVPSVQNTGNYIRPLDLLESNSLIYFRS